MLSVPRLLRSSPLNQCIDHFLSQCLVNGKPVADRSLYFLSDPTFFALEVEGRFFDVSE